MIKATDTTKHAKRGGALNWFTTSESPNLDVSTANLSNNDKLLLAYNVLLQVKPGNSQASDREVIGDLAESWEWSPDGLTITLKLRQGVKWHNKAPVNGRAFDIDDVIFSWDRFTRLSGDRGQIANSANPDAPVLSFTATDAKHDRRSSSRSRSRYLLAHPRRATSAPRSTSCRRRPTAASTSAAT